MSDIDNDQQDAIFEQAMADEAASGVSVAPEPDDEPITPSEALAATVDSARADAKANQGATPPLPDDRAPPKVEFGAEDYLRIREERNEFERRLREIEAQGKKATDQAAQKAGLFEDPEAWEAQIRAEAKADRDEAINELRRDALVHDFAQTAEKVGAEKWAAAEKALDEAMKADPRLLQQFKALSPFGAGQAVIKWYDATEIVRDPSAYEARLREKILAEMGQNAPNEFPAGQKPATGATAAGSNVTRLPPSLARQSSARAANSADDGDDSEAAIYAAGVNPPRRQA